MSHEYNFGFKKIYLNQNFQEKYFYGYISLGLNKFLEVFRIFFNKKKTENLIR